MTGPVEFLEAAHKEAGRLAARAADLCGCHPSALSWSFRDGDEPTDGRILVVDDPHPDLKRKIGRRWNGSYEGLFMAEHIVLHDPESVLRRVAQERRTLDACTEILSDPNGWEYSDAPDLATAIIRNLAEGWGWTETPPKPDWPECMCTPTGECGRCWEKRQTKAAT